MITLRSAIAPVALAARVALAQPVAAEGESSALRDNHRSERQSSEVGRVFTAGAVASS